MECLKFKNIKAKFFLRISNSLLLEAYAINMSFCRKISKGKVFFKDNFKSKSFLNVPANEVEKKHSSNGIEDYKLKIILICNSFD